MSIWSALRLYLIAAAVFLLLDLLWLGLVAQGLYERHLGDLLAEDPNVAAAVLFYAIFLAGLVYFVIAPAVEQRSPRSALVRGAAFGLVTYATWDLTSLAVIEGFPVAIVPVDMAWGAVLAAAVSTATYYLSRPRGRSRGAASTTDRPGT